MAAGKDPQSVVESCVPKDVNRKEAVSKANGRKKGTQRSKIIIKHDCSVPKPPDPDAIQRQRTVTLLGNKRKSHSQIDLKEVRRNGNTPHNATATAMSTDNEAIMLADNPFVAGMRVYNEIMLNSWRKRAEKIKNLTAQVESHKQIALNNKNQLHVYKSLFTDEQARTNELREELNGANDSIASLQQSVSDLKSQLANSEKKRANVESQLAVKTQDHLAVNVYFKRTKNELYKLMTDHQATQTQLEEERQKVLQLEAERKTLLQSIQLINDEASVEEDRLQVALESKNNEITDMAAKLQQSSAELQALKGKYELEFNRFSSEELKLRGELEALRKEADALCRCLAGTLGQRIRNCWDTSIMLKRTSFGFVHWFGAALLPALPPPMAGAPGLPTMPRCFLTIEKAINMVVKR